MGNSNLAFTPCAQAQSHAQSCCELHSSYKHVMYLWSVQVHVHDVVGGTDQGV